MTREDIIRMAREAGLPIFDAAAVANDPAEQAMADIVTKVWHDSAERFAHFVAAAEREACAKVCEEERNELLWREGQTLPRGEPRLIHMAGTASQCAAAIRARGEK